MELPPVPLVSLIIPVLDEEQNVAALWPRLRAVADGLPEYRFEVIFVDDGSTDVTVERIRAFEPSERLSWVVIELSRNFGHQAALSAGMQHAAGEAVILLDADLQDPPELIPQLLEKFREGYDVVYGVRRNRKEPLWLRLCFGGFYRVFNSIAERAMPLDAGDFGLMSRRVVKLVAAMPEYDRLIRGLRSWIGFRQIGIPYDRPVRGSGRPRFSLGRRIEGALDGLFGFSKVPIRFAFLFGVFVFVVCSVYLLQSYVMMLVTGDSGVIGWRSVITLAFMLGGANLVATAIVGEYVCRIYFQSKGRPQYVVAATSRSGPS